MTNTTTQVVALALSMLMTVANFAGMNDLATKEYKAADKLASAPDGQTHVAHQNLTIVRNRANA